MIHAFISTCLDYCNALYTGINQASLACLQLVQNAAACLLTGTTTPPPRALRSADQLRLLMPKSRQKTRGNRAFSVVAPKLWNELPTHVKMAPTLDTFKSRLKTNFYSLAFNTAWELCDLCLSFIVFLYLSVFYLILWLPFICF